MRVEKIKQRMEDYKHNKCLITKVASGRQLWMFAVADIEDTLTELERLLLENYKDVSFK